MQEVDVELNFRRRGFKKPWFDSITKLKIPLYLWPKWCKKSGIYNSTKTEVEKYSASVVSSLSHGRKKNIQLQLTLSFSVLPKGEGKLENSYEVHGQEAYRLNKVLRSIIEIEKGFLPTLTTTLLIRALCLPSTLSGYQENSNTYQKAKHWWRRDKDTNNQDEARMLKTKAWELYLRTLG